MRAADTRGQTINTNETIRIFFAGVLLTGLLLAALQPGRYAFAYSARSSGESLFAIAPGPGELVLIDPGKQHLAYYRYENRRFVLHSGRYFGYDTALYDRNDPKGIDVDSARESRSKDLDKPRNN